MQNVYLTVLRISVPDLRDLIRVIRNPAKKDTELIELSSTNKVSLV